MHIKSTRPYSYNLLYKQHVIPFHASHERENLFLWRLGVPIALSAGKPSRRRNGLMMWRLKKRRNFFRDEFEVVTVIFPLTTTTSQRLTRNQSVATISSHCRGVFSEASLKTPTTESQFRGCESATVDRSSRWIFPSQVIPQQKSYPRYFPGGRSCFFIPDKLFDSPATYCIIDALLHADGATSERSLTIRRPVHALQISTT